MNSANRKHFITGDVESGIDAKVYNSILQTHSKEAITLLDIGLLSVTSTENEMIERVQFTECDILPFHQHDIECKPQSPLQNPRLPSVNKFDAKNISLNTITDILLESFGADEQGRRPYPSAGGLYPVEPLVFLFEDRIEEDLLSGCYHFRANSHKLQLIQKMDCQQFYHQLFHQMIADSDRPSFCVLYVAHSGKSIFKYRYRGYRHAVMEAGAMYQQATMVAQNHDLRTTAWSSFGDHEFMQALNLDYGVFLPITMQLFGFGQK